MENRLMFLILVLIILWLLLTEKGKETVKKFTSFLSNDGQSKA